MREITVQEAARRLSISEQRVRALLQAGRLDGHKVGRSWILDGIPDAARRGQAGRPLKASNSWALLALLSGERPSWVDPTVLARLKRRARNHEVAIRGLRYGELRSRVYRWYVLPSDIAKLVGGFSLVLSGLSVAHLELNVISVGQQLDAYADQNQLHKIEQRFRPDREPDKANLILRVPSHPWILSHFDEAPLAVIAADLIDDEDPRVAGAAVQFLQKCCS
ncbi:MAG: helix-turn-helix domain-containing protein [Actinomycetota bacterium]